MEIRTTALPSITSIKFGKLPLADSTSDAGYAWGIFLKMIGISEAGSGLLIAGKCESRLIKQLSLSTQAIKPHSGERPNSSRQQNQTPSA